MEWRECFGYPDYEISEYGDVRRTIENKYHPAGFVLKKSKDSAGYPKYALFKNKKKKQIATHRLVALTFIGEPPLGDYEVAHWDGSKTNCHYSNLRWVTPSGNYRDRHRHGTENDGQKNGRAILTKEKVLEIYHDKRSIRISAIAYGISKAQIQRIRAKTQWKSVLEFA